MPPRSRMAVDAGDTPTPADEPTASEATGDETPAPVDESTVDESTVDETPAAADEQPAEAAAPVVTCVRVTEAFTASYGCQLLPFAAGEIVRGPVAVYLSTAGVPVEPVDED